MYGFETTDVKLRVIENLFLDFPAAVFVGFCGRVDYLKRTSLKLYSKMLLPNLLELVHAFAGRPAFPRNLLHFRILSGTCGPLCCRESGHCPYIEKYFRIVARVRPQASVTTLNRRMVLEMSLNTIFAYCSDTFPESSEVPGYVVDDIPLPMRLLTYGEALLEGVHDFNNNVIGHQY